MTAAARRTFGVAIAIAAAIFAAGAGAAFAVARPALPEHACAAGGDQLTPSRALRYAYVFGAQGRFSAVAGEDADFAPAAVRRTRPDGETGADNL